MCSVAQLFCFVSSSRRKKIERMNGIMNETCQTCKKEERNDETYKCYCLLLLLLLLLFFLLMLL